MAVCCTGGRAHCGCWDSGGACVRQESIFQGSCLLVTVHCHSCRCRSLALCDVCFGVGPAVGEQRRRSSRHATPCTPQQARAPVLLKELVAFLLWPLAAPAFCDAGRLISTAGATGGFCVALPHCFSLRGLLPHPGQARILWLPHLSQVCCTLLCWQWPPSTTCSSYSAQMPCRFRCTAAARPLVKSIPDWNFHWTGISTLEFPVYSSSAASCTGSLRLACRVDPQQRAAQHNSTSMSRACPCTGLHQMQSQSLMHASLSCWPVVPVHALGRAQSPLFW